jgi:hypothetical protein
VPRGERNKKQFLLDMQRYSVVASRNSLIKLDRYVEEVKARTQRSIEESHRLACEEETVLKSLKQNNAWTNTLGRWLPKEKKRNYGRIFSWFVAFAIVYLAVCMYATVTIDRIRD